MATLLLHRFSPDTPILAEIGGQLGLQVVCVDDIGVALGLPGTPGVVVLDPRTIAHPETLCRSAADVGWRALWLAQCERPADDGELDDADAFDLLDLPLSAPVVTRRLRRAARATCRPAVDDGLLNGFAHSAKNCSFGLSATLEAMNESLHDTELASYASVLGDELTRLSAMIDDLLVHSRPHVPDAAPVSVAPVIQRAVLSCGNLARRLGVQVDSDLGEPVELAMSPQRLADGLRRLIEHAVRRSPSPGRVRVVSRRTVVGDRPVLECRVEDDGPPLPDVEIPALFDAFRRGAKGAGLALAVARCVVQQHGGRVAAANRPEGGAVLTAWLPI